MSPVAPAHASGLAADVVTRYAEAVLGYIDLREGETLLVDCELGHRELAEAIVAAGYRAGAALVDVVYADRRLARARIVNADEDALGVVSGWHRTRLRAALRDDCAIVRIVGDDEPGVMAGVDPARTARDFGTRARTLSWFSRAVVDDRVRWTIVAWPTAAWARQVYPELRGRAAVRRLAEDLVAFARLAGDDPRDAWVTHATMLERRARALTRRRFDRLEFRGPGTELDVALAADGVWLGGGDMVRSGRKTYANVPTEEVFTSPLPGLTEGTFRCTTPLSFNGRVIAGIHGRFRRGRLVEIGADREEDRAVLEQTFSTDRGAGRLGEVALVDRESRVGRMGRIYGETLLDENAASHIAFGNGFGGTRTEGGRLNHSAIHVDVMIGSDAVEVTGVSARGRRTPILEGGEWRLRN